MKAYGARLPPDGGSGTEPCHECDGSGACIVCYGERRLAGARCSGCGGDGACVMWGGRGTLPGGTLAYHRAQGWHR